MKSTRIRVTWGEVNPYMTSFFGIAPYGYLFSFDDTDDEQKKISIWMVNGIITISASAYAIDILAMSMRTIPIAFTFSIFNRCE